LENYLQWNWAEQPAPDLENTASFQEAILFISIYISRQAIFHLYAFHLHPLGCILICFGCVRYRIFTKTFTLTLKGENDMASYTLRAVGDRRVSMREQVDGFSLEAQTESIRKFVFERDWKLVNIYTDSGISAKKDSARPQFARLMEDAKAGHFDVVIVDKINRFYRHLNGLLNALDQLNAQKVTFVSVQERIDFTTPWGKLTLTMLAEIYIDNLRQETQKGKLQRARDGWWNGNIPLGYCRGLCSKCDDPNGPGYCPEVGKSDKSDGRMLVAHPIDGQAVKLAFDLYLRETQNDVSIAEKLNQTTLTLPDGTQQAYRQKGIPGRKDPRMYTKDFVRGMLTQVFYTGKVAYCGRGRKRQIESLFPGKHPALVSEDDCQRIAEVR
jgi:DNA invertase Pin-like site-specific DNA recombinase